MEPNTEHAPRRSRSPLQRLAGPLALSLAVIVADQLSKAAVRASLHPGEVWPRDWELIRFSHVHNTGAAFGILEGASTFLVIAPLIAIAAITFFLLMLPSSGRWYPLALAAILGGAVGNLIDRIRLGYVTDFIDPTHYPSFNLADSAVVIGVFTIAVLSFLAPGEDDEEEPEHAPGDGGDRQRSEAQT
ncbi:MAG: signal peptidase II [Dehalococcoidia bacterium]|nr:signal peptidase II [Dehalococcoidia bacterium]MCB9483486.1 signal peptidase II [Dehalococcoidia bacterium]